MRPTSENWSCGYEPEPKNWVCAKDATWHGFKVDGPDIKSMMSSCCDHLINMGTHADFVHPMTSICGIPGSRFKWPENVCYAEFNADSLLEETAEAHVH